VRSPEEEQLRIKVFLDRTVLALVVVFVVAPPAAARMIGGPRCKETQVKLDEDTAILRYHLDCGDESADVMEVPAIRVFLAKVTQLDGNWYSATDGAVGKVLSATKGNHLPQGSEAEGQGRVEVLGQVWICNRVPPSEIERRAGFTTKAACRLP
jgi:hypothetical protein